MVLELVLGGLMAVAQKPRHDPCAGSISAALRAALEVRFPSFKLPAMTDNLPEDIEYNQKMGGNGCLGVAEGDYNGDRRIDKALLLTSREDLPEGLQRILLVVGFARESGWELSVLQDTDYAHRNRVYVGTAPRGVYRRTESLPDPPNEPGEVEKVTSEHAAVTFGVTESSAVVYVWKRGRWQHVWVSN